MKDLKHIKLFEAFESIKLSRTVRFINKDSKSQFLSSLKEITSRIDFQMSQLSDDYFEYLPFGEAINKNFELRTPTQEECNYESEWIKGELCDAGRVKRTWGKGIRTITCPRCGGTGFKMSRPADPELTYIKFWFTKEGKYVNITGNDGRIRNQLVKHTNNGTNGTLSEFSKNINDYTILGDLSHRDARNAPTGTIIKFGTVVGMIYQSTSGGHTYVLQDSHEGGGPWVDFRRYARYSWDITSAGEMKNSKLLKLNGSKEDNIEKEEEDNIEDEGYEKGYSLNNILTARNLSIASSNDVASYIQSAHFAIILDFKALKSGEYKRSSLLSSERNDRRKGALALRKNEDIKSENIKRYIKLLVDKFNIKNGLQEMNKIIPRGLGSGNSIFFIIRYSNIDELDNVYQNIYKIIETGGKVKKDQIEYLQRYITDIYNRAGNNNKAINKNLQKFYTDILTYKGKISEEEYNNRILIIDKILLLGKDINEKLLKTNIETLSDMEVTLHKIKSLREIFYKLSPLSNLRYVIEYTVRDDNRNIAREFYGDVPEHQLTKILKQLDQFKEIVNKI